MSKMISAALLSASLFAASAASAQTPRDASAPRDVVLTTQSTPPAFIARRCSGVACLQGIPQIGVDF